MMAGFNGDMLRLARQFRGLTQREFADALKVDPAAISRVENDLTKPTNEIAEHSATLLDLPLAFFEQEERVYGQPVSVHPMWRKKAATPQRSIDQAFAEINIRILQLRKLLRSVEYERITELPEFDLGLFNGGAEEVAALVRRTWLMPAGPVRDLTSWVERAGCFVMHIDLPDAAMAGVTIRAPGLPPCIFIQRDMPADRMRFTLAHELGHLVMHRLPTQSMEDEANRFAGAFLMPAKDIRPFFVGKKIDLRLLAALKPEWRVAMQSLLVRADQLGMLTETQTRYLWQQFNMKKIRMREPAELDFPTEKPSLISKLIRLHVSDLEYSVADMSKVLFMHEHELLTFYDFEAEAKRRMLRVVS